MLFNSYIFIFLFLPATLFGFYIIRLSKHSHLAIAWLVVASLFFYAWWNPVYLGLILCSILFNYTLGKEIGSRRQSSQRIVRKIFLTIGITANLGLLGYCKYANFFVNNFNQVFHTQFVIGNIVLPLAISFFTFQQITYLMDIYRGISIEHRFLHYCVFVTFFPHLIAGPLVHHMEMLPQFTRKRTRFFSPRYFALGITIFVIGLFKKLLIADGIEYYASPVFKAAADGEMLTFLEAWGGAWAYTYQLYFDFSGYSDMAIGLALLFGIRLPLNFYSPYKAINIIDFWNRWHMSLSRFLFNYLYIPLGGNRHGVFKQCINIMIVMLLGGLWHGAGWGFIIWGCLHGAFLIVNHLCRLLRTFCGQDISKTTMMGAFLSRCLTFLLIVVAWVFFRAENLHAAMSVLTGMSGGNGIVLWKTYYAPLNHMGGLGDKLVSWGIRFNEPTYFKGIKEIGWLLILSMIAWFAPNTHQIMLRYKTAFNIYRGKHPGPVKQWFQWRPTILWAVITSILALLAILNLSAAKEFIYFQF